MQEELLDFILLHGNGLKLWELRHTVLMCHIFHYGIQTTMDKMITQTGLKLEAGHGLLLSNSTKINRAHAASILTLTL